MFELIFSVSSSKNGDNPIFPHSSKTTFVPFLRNPSLLVERQYCLSSFELAEKNCHIILKFIIINTFLLIKY